jgi:hypothetical protein
VCSLAGLRPDTIHTRIARKTYGVEIASPWTTEHEGGKFEKILHSEKKTFYANNVFSKFVAIGKSCARACLPRG